MSETEPYQHWRCRDCAKKDACKFGKRDVNEVMLNYRCWWYEKENGEKNQNDQHSEH